MAYVDGFVVPVKIGDVERYLQVAEQAGKVWREYGALEFRECRADDVKPGKLTSFPQSVKLEDDEVVFFSWIVWASRAERDRLNPQVMADPRLADLMDPAKVPFALDRMIFGGFEMLIDL